MAIYYVASSLDGFIADENDSVDFLESVPEPDTDTYAPFIETIGAIAMGRASYEFILAHMAQGNDWPYDKPCWVFTHHKFAPQTGVIFVSGAVEDAYPEMAQHGQVWIVGGGELAGQFLDAGLLDELIVTVASATLAAGRPLLPRPAKLDLISARSLGAGFAELRYQVSPASV